ncbi:MAG: dynamin family protein [Chromatiales bacterium]|jgi:hypothetical protein
MALQQQLHAYQQWKKRLRDNIRAYRNWLEAHDMAQAATLQRIELALETLHGDRLTVAFVAEFSRGKTELINAMFFADQGRRLLPSTAGRTTMCPVELFYDREMDEPYLKLLPIETRLEDTRLSDLKNDLRKWVHYPLALHSPEQIQQILSEMIQTKSVSVEEAGRLGLYDRELHSYRDEPAAEVEIPRWRHALISYPHPLLEQGLILIDTPGLNALGAEPELTLELLPGAQGVVFVLAADTGVTRSDLEMWRNHLRGFQSRRQRGLMVVLNKVDTLWDDLQGEAEIDAAIQSQRTSVATILGIRESAVFPVSAQKGLLAKVSANAELLERSRLGELERFLSDDVLQAKHEILRETVTGEVAGMVERTRGVLATQLAGVRNQREELTQLDGQSDNLLAHMKRKVLEERARYQRTLEAFKTSRELLRRQGRELLDALDPDGLDVIIDQAHDAMQSNWTTPGLQRSMGELLHTLRARMYEVTERSEQTRKLLRSVYHRFHSEHGFPQIQPAMLSVMKHRVDLELLHQEAEVFRRSPGTALTEKHFVIKRFFLAMVARAREVYAETREEAQTWIETALDPLADQLHARKAHIERRLADLQKISRSKQTLDQRLEELNAQYRTLSRDLTHLRNLQFAISETRFGENERRPGPRLVSSRPAAGRD